MAKKIVEVIGMLQLRFDSNGLQQVRWPRLDSEVIDLGRRFIEAEAELPKEKQFPKLELLTERFKIAQEAMSSAKSQEANRTTFSQNEINSFGKAKELVRTIIAGLSYTYINETAVLEQWGIPIVQRKTGFMTQTPQSKKAILDLLSQYIKKEESLPENERLPKPPLSEVIAARNNLADSLSSKSSAIAQREKNVEMRSLEAQKLLDLLQLAAAYHLLIDFDGVVDSGLQKLGFKVVAISRPSTPSDDSTPQN
jgi:hypothetical protein